MKTNFTPVGFLQKLLLLAALVFSAQAYAQPDYIFKNPTKISGQSLKQGAKYRFSNVKPGIDAILTLSSISSGVTLTELDGASGYDEALQPTLKIDPWKNGYVEMTINFVVTNTTTPAVQAQISATCIDVDGVTNYDKHGHDLHEFDQINVGGGYVDFNTVGGELSIAQSGNWFTGTNITGIDYPGRDTSATEVMFTVIGANISSMIIRVGINNQTADEATRERSVYFKRFVYENSMLAIPAASGRLTRQISAPAAKVFGVFPNAIESSAKIVVEAAQDGWASFEVVDYSGRLIMRQQLVVNKGTNAIPFFNVSQLSNGSYVAVLKMDGQVYSQKVIRK